MLRVAIAFFIIRLGLADESWQDTPILTSLWQATSSKDNDAIDRLLDSSESAASARSGDGRGLAWWAWEFQNEYVLASIIVNGGDVTSEDEDEAGKPAYRMCSDSSDCDKESLLQKAKALVEEVKKAKEQRAAEREKEDFDDEEEEEELGDDEF
ncbi:P2RX4 [Symbiodinium natans]|uniref:P2RX4 protein n=1 Tax=Symbiodinium natans TaxID=878477 RepID=A0A812I349_9DINO|nr:P2RX4 [Symbiodinium natans]